MKKVLVGTVMATRAAGVGHFPAELLRGRMDECGGRVNMAGWLAVLGGGLV